MDLWEIKYEMLDIRQKIKDKRNGINRLAFGKRFYVFL